MENLVLVRSSDGNSYFADRLWIDTYRVNMEPDAERAFVRAKSRAKEMLARLNDYAVSSTHQMNKVADEQNDEMI